MRSKTSLLKTPNANVELMPLFTGIKENIQLFRQRLSEKVHATMPKGIVGGFEFAVEICENGARGHRLMFVIAKGKKQ